MCLNIRDGFLGFPLPRPTESSSILAQPGRRSFRQDQSADETSGNDKSQEIKENQGPLTARDLDLTAIVP